MLVTMTARLVRSHGKDEIPLPGSGRIEYRPESHGTYQGALRGMDAVVSKIAEGVAEPVELTPGPWRVTVVPDHGPAWRSWLIELEPGMPEPVDLVDLAPVIVIDGEKWAKGDPGRPGVSVVGSVDQGDGTIRFVLSDGSQTDPVTLPPGPTGRGIDSISDPSPEGMVTVTYTDGTTQDVRAIRGQDGRGIASISDPDAESRVTVTYTDGDTQQVQAIRGRDGRAPVIEWAGTALVVDGVAGPDLRGAPGPASTVPGPAGPPGAVPVASDYLVVGPGRPDAPTTTGFSAAQIAALPVGCEYRSTDGASVGAWVWRKRPTGWTVTQGDTGWVTLTDPDVWASGGMMVRRVDSNLYWKVGTGQYGLSNWSAAFANGTLKASVIPAPFRPQGTSAYITLRTDGASKTVVGAFEIQTTGHIVRRTTDNGTLTSDALSGPTSNPWPTTLTP